MKGDFRWGRADSQCQWLDFWGFILISRRRGTIKGKKEIIGIKMTRVLPS